MTLLKVYKEELLLPTMIRENTFLTTDETIENSLKTFATNRKLKGTSPFDTFLENMVLKLRDATGNYWTSKKEVMKNLAATKTFMIDLYNSAALPNQTEEILPLIPKTYTVTIKEIQDWTSEQFRDRTQINWLKFFQIVLQKTGLTITEDTEILCADTFGTILYNLINLVEKTDPDTIKNYCLLRIFLFMAPDSDSDSRREFDEYFKGLNKQLYSREEYCTRKIIDLAGTASLSYAVAYEYQLRYFNVNKLEKAKDMIFYLWNSFTDILSNEIDWMDSDSKSHALNKVKNMITLLGYPEKSEDKEDIDEFYENLRICNWDNFGNAKNIRAFKMAYQLSQSKSRDRTVWDKSPFDANAYYTRATNRIIFPVAMLNPVFFTGEISILDYGRIGSIIGHEITHGFDSKGSTYNEDGLVKNWMSKDSKEAFNKKAECFKEQYNKYYIPQAQKNVSGARTLDENLADNGGIRESYKALKQYLLDNPSSYIVENYTDDQLFFIGFGTMWCSDASDSYYQQLATYGLYPPTKYRVNGPVSNLEEFSRAFNCPIGSNMNPEDKCRLW
ncbi:unnamed protein product [Brassicogethes aeneus]|uniref:Uncharacterized protein n=1 Tax=Brassicogethes aeneus TaxID=1431903 RepID=A0A9P0AVB4_BRAAE|nr:unnamed protein product [Brassicogethes aeneus]